MITQDDLDCGAVFFDCGPLGSKTGLAIEGKFFGEFEKWDQALKTFDDWQKENNYYPTAYYVNDHGNITELTSGDLEIE